MDADSTRQLLALQNEINILKSALNPMFQLLQEIQEIRKKHHISQSYNISNIAIISLEIKEDILKDVSSMQQTMSEKVEEVRVEAKTNLDSLDLDLSRVKDDVYNGNLLVKDLNRDQISLKHASGEAALNIKQLLREMEQRATLNNIEEIRHVLKNMTPLSSFDNLKARVSDCVSTYQFQNLQREAETTKQKLKKYIKTEDLTARFQEFSASLDKSFRTSFITSEVYSETNETIEKKIKETHQMINSSREFVMKLDNATNEKVRIVKKSIDSKPWKSELYTLQEEVNLKVSKSEIEGLTKGTVESVKNFSVEMYRFKNSVEKFEKVLERFDEILLDKAEKDEVKKLNNAVSLAAPAESVAIIKNQFVTFTKDSDNRFQAQCAMVEKIKGNFDYILDKFEAMKREIFDVTNLSASVAEFKEAVERKADKQDIFEIYDNMCKRIDFVEANESLKVMKKQLEQAAGLMFSLCRTFLDSGEPISQIKKQRYELFKNFNSLVNWVTGENHMISVNINTSRVGESMDQDDNLDIRFPSRHSVFLRRQSAATAKNSKRAHIDFPKIA